MYIRPSVHLSLRSSICLSVCPSICLSICLFVCVVVGLCLCLWFKLFSLTFLCFQIRQRLSDLAKAKSALDDTWLDRRHRYAELIDQQQFYRDARQIDDMSNAQEIFLLNDDLADTVDGVEAMLKKHEAFEKTVAAQEEKVTSLVEFSDRLLAAAHFDTDNIKSLLERVLER